MFTISSVNKPLSLSLSLSLSILKHPGIVNFIAVFFFKFGTIFSHEMNKKEKLQRIWQPPRELWQDKECEMWAMAECDNKSAEYYGV